MKNKRFNDMMTCLHGYRVCADKLNYIMENLMMYGEDVTLKDIVNDLERQQSVFMKDAMEAFQGNDEVEKKLKLFKDLKPGDSFYYYHSGSIDSLHKVNVKGIHKDDLRNEVMIAAEFPEGEVILRYNSSLWNKHTHTETLDNQIYFDIVSTDKGEFMDMMRKLTGHSTWKMYLKKLNDMEKEYDCKKPNLIEKACKWLKEKAYSYNYIKVGLAGQGDTHDIEGMIEDFRKAMEE